MPYMLSAPVDLKPVGAQSRGNKPGRLQVSSKTELDGHHRFQHFDAFASLLLEGAFEC